MTQLSDSSFFGKNINQVLWKRINAMRKLILKCNHRKTGK